MNCCALIWVSFLQVILGYDMLSSYSQKDLDFLSNVDTASLPRNIQLTLFKSKRSQESGFCCKSAADMVVPVRTETHEKFRTQNVARTIVAKVPCNHPTHGRGCYKSSLVYEVHIVSYVETILIPDPSLCPAKDLACCLNHIMVAGSCIDITDSSLIHSVQDIIALQESGLLASVHQ